MSQFFEGPAHRGSFFGSGAGRFEKQAAALGGETFGAEEREIQRSFGANAHGARQGERAGMSFILEKDSQAIDEQGLRDAIEDRADQRLDTHFIGERTAEFNQGAAVIEAIAVEEAVEPGLYAFTQGFDQERRNDDGDDAANGAGRKSRAMK